MEKFTFPNFRDVYNFAPKYRIQHLKFTVRCLIHSRSIKMFENFVNTSEHYQAFFRRYPQDAYPLIHAYMDKRFNSSSRLDFMRRDLECAQNRFGQNNFKAFCDIKNLPVLSEPVAGLEICLNRNDNCVDEGWWAISLRNENNDRLYAATFAFFEDRLLVGSVQGPAGEHAKDSVRQSTKKLHGLRPQNLVVIVLQYLAQSLKLKGVLGIAQDNQVKLRWRLKKRVQMNYDVFWKEADASLQPDGYWHLPSMPARKELTEIESKKRSMYRKRYEMLDKVFADIQQFFHPEDF